MKYLAVCLIIVLLKAAAARAEVEHVSFLVMEFSGKTTNLTARLTKPEGEGPFPAIVHLHGCDGTNLGLKRDLEETLKPMGYVSLRIDSFGPRGFTHACDPAMSPAPPSVRALDAHAGKDFLETLPYVDPDRIGVVGWSHGGIATLTAVSNDALNEQDRPNPFQAAVAFYPQCSFKLRRLDAPLLVLIGDADTSTPVAYCEAMAQEGESAYSYELVVFPGATHAFDWVDSPGEFYGHMMTYDPVVTEDAYSRVAEFFALHLQTQ